MKQWMRIFAVMFAAVLVGQSCAFAEGGDLSYLTKQKKEIKVFLKDFTNESGQSQVSIEDFKKAMEAALLNRKSVIFAIVKTPAESDVQVSAVIKKFQYLKEDPIRPSPSAATLILDAATTENFVEMAADFMVVDTKNGKVAWEDNVETFIKRTMTPAESIPLIYEKLSRNFLAKSFGKPK